MFSLTSVYFGLVITLSIYTATPSFPDILRAGLPWYKPVLSNVNKVHCSRVQYLVLAGVESANWLTNHLESDALTLRLHRSTPPLTLLLLSTTCPVLANSVDPDQLASSEAN